MVKIIKHLNISTMYYLVRLYGQNNYYTLISLLNIVKFLIFLKQFFLFYKNIKKKPSFYEKVYISHLNAVGMSNITKTEN